MTLRTKTSTSTKSKTKKSSHIGTAHLQASNAIINDICWTVGKLQRDKLRGGLYLIEKAHSDLTTNLANYISLIKTELQKQLTQSLKHDKTPADIKETKQRYKRKLHSSIHYAPQKVKTICWQLAMSQLEKQHAPMIELPFTYLLSEEQMALCLHKTDRGFVQSLGQRIQRKLREKLDYSPSFYFSFENPPVPVEKRKTFHDTLPHIHGAMLFQPNDAKIIRQAMYDLNNADKHSVFHLQEFRLHKGSRKECVAALGEFMADVGWAIYQTKGFDALKFYHHSRKIKGFEKGFQFATQEVTAMAKEIYKEFRAIYNKSAPKKAKKSICVTITASTYSAVVNTAFDESEATVAASVTIVSTPTAAEIEKMCDEIIKSGYSVKETECICNDLFRNGITAELLSRSLADGNNLFDKDSKGRSGIFYVASELLMSGRYTKKDLIETYSKSRAGTVKDVTAKRRSLTVHNVLKILDIISH